MIRSITHTALGLLAGLLLVGLAAPVGAQSLCGDLRLDMNDDGIINNVDQGLCFGCTEEAADCWADCALWDLDDDGSVGFSDVGQITLECPNWSEVFTPMEPLDISPEDTPTETPTPTPSATSESAPEEAPDRPVTGTATPAATPASTMTPAATPSRAKEAEPTVAPASTPEPPSSGSGGVLVAVAVLAAIGALGVLAYIRWWRARWL
jgi:hypothetical protein